jgi:hypothetical protein
MSHSKKINKEKTSKYFLKDSNFISQPNNKSFDLLIAIFNSLQIILKPGVETVARAFKILKIAIFFLKSLRDSGNPHGEQRFSKKIARFIILNTRSRFQLPVLG